MWQDELPQKVNDLFNESTLTINDLEPERLVINWLALECLASNLSNTHTALFCNNTSEVGWTFKLISGSSLAARRLLRFLFMHIHTTQDSHLKTISMEGKDNYMADVVYRAFQKGNCFADKKNLTEYFLKITPPSHRDTPGPNQPFLPSGRNK